MKLVEWPMRPKFCDTPVFTLLGLGLIYRFGFMGRKDLLWNDGALLLSNICVADLPDWDGSQRNTSLLFGVYPV